MHDLPSADHRIPEPFHAGELRAQRMAGVAPRRPGTVAIRDRMPDQHREFFAQLPFLCVAVPDATGWPLATLVQGTPGFVQAPTNARLAIAALPDVDDPARAHVVPGATVGMLGIELATRRRNRANGVVGAVDGSGFVVNLDQSFGNCPRYIHPRGLASVARTRGPVLDFGFALPESARLLIAASTTLFVASASAHGLDISHRGGPAGFVRVDGGVLTVLDYAGNRFFNTIGNFLVEPRAAIVLFDPASGDVLQLQGEVEVDWTPGLSGDAEPAVECSWRFTVTRGWLRPGAFGLGAAA